VTVPEFVCHPAALYTRTIEGIGNIGTLTSRNALETEGPVRETENPLWITDDIVFLGEIPTKFDFEKRTPIGILHTPEGMVPDMIPDDSALVCLAEEGIIIVTGCSHAGICSIIEYAKEVTGCDRITDVIGGFHLYDAGDDRISKTAKYLRSIRPRQLHPCHCTGNRAISLFGAVAPGEEVGVGLTLEY
jgi:7,8-dihydropterin-6-yl-methyl-4-(beta-D-ribofuranosyl)aminobenzene 5'-phosphate synthase